MSQDGYPQLNDPIAFRARNLLADSINTLIGRWYWVILPMALALATAWYYLSVAPPVYGSTTTIQVKVSSTGGPVPSDTRAADDLDLRNVDAINTIVGKLKLPSLIQSTLEQHPELLRDPELVPQELSWTPRWLREQNPSLPVPTNQAAALAAMIIKGEIFQIKPRRQTRLVDVSASHSSPRMSRLLAEALIETYMKVYTEQSKNETLSAFDFLKKEAENVRVEMGKAQLAQAAYVTALALNTKLEIQEAELATLLLRYRDKHPRVIQTRKQLKETQDSFMLEFDAARRSPADAEHWKKQQLADKGTIGNNPAPPESAPPRSADSAREDAVLEASRQLKSRSKVLESEMEGQKANFDNLQAQFSKVDLTQKSDNQDAQMIPVDPAQEGTLIGPIASTTFAIYGFAGLALGIGLALLLQRLDNRIHTVADLEQLSGFPVIASVAALRPEVLQRSAGEAGTNQLIAKWSPDLFFRDNGSKSVEAEMIRILRTSIILLGPQEDFKTILFTSSLPSEGKSFTSANVAVSFAMQGMRTLLVDMDLRKPKQHKLFGTDRHKGAGIVDLLAGQCALSAAIHPSGLDNLFLMSAGSHAPNPAEILNVERLKQLFSSLKSQFDRVIIDTAPLLPVSDTRLISRSVDACILVVGAESTPKGAIRRAFELLGSGLGGERPARVVGCVLNGTVESRRNLGYNYSYGYYGKYYGKYGGKYGEGYGSVYGEEDEDQESSSKKKV